jgi:hypothetical protein
MSANNTEKLKVLLPHWAEHNKEHAAELRRWRGEISENAEIAALLDQAANLLDQATAELELASRKLGGTPLSEHHHHHHDSPRN